MSQPGDMLRTNQEFLNFMETYAVNNPAVVQKSFAPGARLIRQGDTIRHVYMILDGITKCYIAEDNGKDYIFEFLGKGEITGELEAINKGACLCNIEAITPVQAYAIPHSQFAALVQNNPTFNQLLLQELATRISQTCIRASYQQLYPLEYALLRLLTLEADQHLLLAKRDMAAYLGISVRSFNRTLKELRERNIMHTTGLHIDLTKQQLENILKRFEE